MKIKKLISILLATLIMLSAFSIISFGDYSTETDAPIISREDDYPLIIIPGINHSVSYLANDDGTPYTDSQGNEVSGGLLIVNSDGLVLKLIKKLLFPLISSIVLQFDNGLSNAAYDAVCELMSLQSCDKDGNQVYNLATYTYDYPVSEFDKETKEWFYINLPIQKVTEKIGEDKVYLFTYPLVGNPMESAVKLRDYIKFVKQKTGFDKVNLATVSLGGTILTAYADTYNDWSDVNRIINVVSCLNGSDIFADFYARKWNLDADFLYRDYLRGIFKQSDGSAALGCVINSAVRLLSKDTVYAVLTGAFSGVLDTLFINDAQFWAMMPHERYDELSERYISDAEHTKLKEKTDAFQKARINLKNNLLKASEQGVLINNICGSDLTYNDGDYCFLGIVASSKSSNSDGIVPVYSASLGATTVPAGTEFSSDYLKSKDKNHISEFKSIDASTCLFPDNVWFFQKQHHEVGTNDAVMELLSRIATGEISNIYSDSMFPQFMGTRYTKQFTRWMFPQAEKVFANADGEYSQEDIDEVTVAYNEAKELLSDYSVNSNEQEKIDAAYDKLDKALVKAGARPEEKESILDEPIEKVCLKTDDFIFSVFKDNGYFDWTGIGKALSKIAELIRG